MNFFYYIIFVFFFIYGCSDFKTETKYFDNTDIVEYEIPYLNEDPHGVIKKYYRNGTLKEKSTWKNGTKEGDHTFYYKNGQIKAIAPFISGIQKGWVVQYDTLGNLTARFQYDFNAIDGDYIEYHPNGILAKKLQYDQGELDGIGLEYSYTSNKLISSFFENGEEIYRKEYNENGYVIKSMLPVEFLYTPDSLCLNLKYSDIHTDSLAVIVYIGKLDNDRNLIDTIYHKSSLGAIICLKNNELKGNYKIEGHFCEVKYPNRIEGRSPFNYNLKKY